MIHVRYPGRRLIWDGLSLGDVVFGQPIGQQRSKLFKRLCSELLLFLFLLLQLSPVHAGRSHYRLKMRTFSFSKRFW
jgi:hypothetical protein